jgi:hypothetical protein
VKQGVEFVALTSVNQRRGDLVRDVAFTRYGERFVECH